MQQELLELMDIQHRASIKIEFNKLEAAVLAGGGGVSMWQACRLYVFDLLSSNEPS